ncbi:MAG TPA: flagellar basal body L-ring protein FlgH [Candidatus Sulfopaludibacter sp.]|nr:flagellar basal body L-ring protein FlgH [Candidatus Sulfopaludibacter sp.]
MKIQNRPCLKVLVIALLALVEFIAAPQSLWRPDTSKTMFADKRASAVGDIITILIEENSTASKNNETKTEKSSSLSAAIASFLYPQSAGGFLSYKGQMPAMQYSSDLKHDGSGSINNSEAVVAKIAVRIKDVLPNNNFVVEGRRETSFSGERQTIILQGVVRSEDIQPGNTVYSYNVADATIQMIGKGTVTDSQRKGWFTRIWDFVNPF